MSDPTATDSGPPSLPDARKPEPPGVPIDEQTVSTLKSTTTTVFPSSLMRTETTIKGWDENFLYI